MGRIADQNEFLSPYPTRSRIVSCPAKSSLRCSMVNVCPSDESDQQSQKCISRAANCSHDSITSSSPCHLAAPRTGLPFNRFRSCSPFIQHLKMARSWLPSSLVTTTSSSSSRSDCSILIEIAFGGGPANLLLRKFAFQIPVKLTLIYLQALPKSNIGNAPSRTITCPSCRQGMVWQRLTQHDLRPFLRSSRSRNPGERTIPFPRPAGRCGNLRVWRGAEEQQFQRSSAPDLIDAQPFDKHDEHADAEVKIVRRLRAEGRR